MSKCQTLGFSSINAWKYPRTIGKIGGIAAQIQSMRTIIFGHTHNLQIIYDNVKLFLQFFKDFWNSSNGIYVILSDWLSCITSLSSGICGSAASTACLMAVSL